VKENILNDNINSAKSSANDIAQIRSEGDIICVWYNVFTGDGSDAGTGVGYCVGIFRRDRNKVVKLTNSFESKIYLTSTIHLN
jgi:hypothetical protein